MEQLIFVEKLSEAKRKASSLKMMVEKLKLIGNPANVKRKNLIARNQIDRKRNDMKLAFSEFYLTLIILQDYQELNKTGFRKILKKYDKVSSNTI